MLHNNKKINMPLYTFLFMNLEGYLFSAMIKLHKISACLIDFVIKSYQFFYLFCYLIFIPKYMLCFVNFQCDRL